MSSYIGEIRMFAGTYAPDGWLLCDGSLLEIADYGDLFNLIGDAFGGNGVNNFRLPDLRSRVPVGAGTTANGVYTLGQVGGAEQVTVSQNELPSHTHMLSATTAAGTSSSPGGNVLAQAGAGIQLYREAAVGSSLNNKVITLIGGSTPHTNIQPYLAVTFIISLYGEYPVPA